jgi:hypothetical protein
MTTCCGPLAVISVGAIEGFRTVFLSGGGRSVGHSCGGTQELTSLPETDTSRSCISPSQFG